MSITNDFQAFAIGGGANVESQAAYLSDPALSSGQQPGIASSALNNKVLRQGTFIASQLAQFIGNKTQTDVIDNGVSAQFLAQIFGALDYKLPVVSTFTSGSGTMNISYKFQIAQTTIAPTSGATYTNNGVTYTVTNTVTGLELIASGNGAPLTSGTLTKASGTGDATVTFYAVRAPVYMIAECIGGGAGGVGGGSNGTAGGNTTFGNLTADGGFEGNGQTAGVGGTASVGSGWTSLISMPGSSGQCGSGALVNNSGGAGGGGAYGGNGSGGQPGAGGNGGGANSGSGGGGTAGNTSTGSGAGGGAGAFIRAIAYAPSGGYAYSVGTAGSGGSAGGLQAGGAGGAGVITVTQYYQ